MNWPKEILIRFLGNNGQAVGGLLIFILLKSKLKNDFGIEPLMSDEFGNVVLSRSELVRSIERAKTEFSMDYDGSIEDCDEFEVIIEGRKELEERVCRLRKYYPENAKRISELMAECVNAKFPYQRAVFGTPISDKLVINLKG